METVFNKIHNDYEGEKNMKVVNSSKEYQTALKLFEEKTYKDKFSKIYHTSKIGVLTYHFLSVILGIMTAYIIGTVLIKGSFFVSFGMVVIVGFIIFANEKIKIFSLNETFQKSTIAKPINAGVAFLACLTVSISVLVSSLGGYFVVDMVVKNEVKKDDNIHIVQNDSIQNVHNKSISTYQLIIDGKTPILKTGGKWDKYHASIAVNAAQKSIDSLNAEYNSNLENRGIVLETKTNIKKGEGMQTGIISGLFIMLIELICVYFYKFKWLYYRNLKTEFLTNSAVNTSIVRQNVQISETIPPLKTRENSNVYNDSADEDQNITFFKKKYPEIVEALKDGKSVNEITQKYKVGTTTIYNIRKSLSA